MDRYCEDGAHCGDVLGAYFRSENRAEKRHVSKHMEIPGVDGVVERGFEDPGHGPQLIVDALAILVLCLDGQGADKASGDERSQADDDEYTVSVHDESPLGWLRFSGIARLDSGRIVSIGQRGARPSRDFQ